jgi:cardiolipin synthase
MFGWREGTVGTKLTDLLVQKLDQGVEVRIIVDAAGSKPYGPAKDMFTRLANAGAQIVVNDTFPWDEDGLYPSHTSFDLRQDDVGRADHRKLYVIDGTVAWTGGAGVEDHFENGGFHDVMARVTGNVVRQAQALFLTAFRAHGGTRPRIVSAPAQPAAGRSRSRCSGRARRVRVGDAGDLRADRPRADAARHHESVLHRRRDGRA